MFNINDLVYIIPTGDPAIDKFGDVQMKIIDIKRVYPEAPRHYNSFLSYTIAPTDYNLRLVGTASVLECEMEYRDA